MAHFLQQSAIRRAGIKSFLQEVPASLHRNAERSSTVARRRSFLNHFTPAVAYLFQRQRRETVSAQIALNSLRHQFSILQRASAAMFQFHAAEGPNVGEPAPDIERYRARHRRLCRGQQPEATPSAQVEDLDVEDGRTRKIPAKWRQQQQQAQVPLSNQFDDGSETHVGFNAFDFSASPEAFNETHQQQQKESRAAPPPCHDNQQLEQQRTVEQDAGDSNARLWERRCPDLGQSGGPARQLPTLGQDALWGGPVHYATHDAQRRALYFQPQYYA